ncbi:hypothetical protein [Steroidobacter agaridevorans]|uniref:hypothetical protein n=1 Tax=Steroidobacter agaridevorans TaxID=2695856 RepID=UPI00132A02DB|nr:hypothetical protein [Steroidobacter agaridevorans]GFE89051.1 hypothetical protein GCM10011488_40050 [Steroidobacter agaridevorans]
MDSKLLQRRLGQEIDQDLLAATQRLSPEQRLDAFLTHSRLMMELYQAGQRARESRQPKSP